MDDLGVEIMFSDWSGFSCHFMKFSFWCTLTCISKIISYGSLVYLGVCNGVFEVFIYHLCCYALPRGEETCFGGFDPSFHERVLHYFEEVGNNVLFFPDIIYAICFMFERCVLL